MKRIPKGTTPRPKPMRRSGTSGMFTPDLGKLIVDLLRGGNPRQTVCRAVGISKNMITNWSRDYPGFGLLCEEAEAAALGEALGVIRTAATGIMTRRTVTKKVGRKVREVTTTEEVTQDWRAAAWLLERRDPENFRLPVDVNVRQLSDDQLLRALAHAAGRGGEAPELENSSESGRSSLSCADES